MTARRLIIVEDNLHDRAEVKALLLRGSTRRYEFREADTGAGCLRLVEELGTSVDCIVMDFDLPDTTAMELLRQLPQESFGPSIPVVIMTGSAGERVSREVLRAGAQDFVGKAWLTEDSITRAIDNAIERHHAARSLARQTERQSLLLEITRLILASRKGEREVVEAIFSRISKHLSLDFCFFLQPGPGDLLHVAWQRGVPASHEAVARDLTSSPTSCQTFYAFDRSTPVLARPFAPDPLARFVQSLGASAYTCLPLVASDGMLLGAIAVASTCRNDFGPEDVKFLQTLCHSLSVAFDRARAEEQHRQAQVSLAQREQELRIIADNIPDIVSRFDRQFRHVFTNASAGRTTGVAADSFLGKTNRELGMPPELCDRIEAAIRKTFETSEPQLMSSEFETPNGQRRLETRMIPERGRDGQVDHVLAVTRDVTDAWKAAEELAQAKDAAEAASAAKDQFLAVLSHELRTPLAPVRMAISMWERSGHAFPDDFRSDLAMIRRNVDLEIRLIDDMLDLNRIARGKLELQMETLNLHDEIRHAIRTVESDAMAKQIRLSFTPGATETTVTADAARLQQILWNVTKNAVKFTPAEGSVSIRTFNPEQGRVCVQITDTGTGIEAAALNSIFTAFEQGGAHVTRQFGGLGLGLAISKALAEMHGGTLVADSAGKGRGATFTLELATATPAESSSSVDGDAPADVPFAEIGRDISHKILLVEDHEDTARLMQRLLGMLGYDVHTAGSISEALRASKATQFDLLISDLGLPDGSGNDLMRQVAQHKPLKAIALSGYGMEEDVRRTQEAGFSAHLTKPINFEQLEVTIRRVIGNNRERI